jgi:hypothetical protein
VVNDAVGGWMRQEKCSPGSSRAQSLNSLRTWPAMYIER